MQEYFKASPFELTASPASASLWAGRAETLSQLRRICRSLKSRSDSSLDLIWANFGGGKTHALYHLGFVAQRELTSGVKSVYFEMPESISGFLDLYRGVISQLSTDDIADAVENSGTACFELKRAARALRSGAVREAELATEWLHAGNPGMRDLRSSTGISRRIDDDIFACDVLSQILAGLSNKRVRFLLLIDEFQRIGTLTIRRRDAVLSRIRTLYSKTPSNLSCVVAIASRMEKTALELLPPELRTLMGIRPIVSLPEMSVEEAEAFVSERFSFFRPEAFVGAPFSPFGPSCVRDALEFIRETEAARMIPRTILQALSVLYDNLEDGGSLATKDQVCGVLEKLRWENLQ